MEPGEECEPPDTSTCDTQCKRIPAATPDAACDLSGDWIAQKITVSLAPGVGSVKAITSNYFYYHFAQDGTAVEVTDSLHCGFEVHSVSVGADGGMGTDFLTAGLSGNTRTALRCLTSSDGRTGTFAPAAGNTCDFKLDLAFFVRALSPQSYWKSDDWGLGSSPMTGDGVPQGCTKDVSGILQCDPIPTYDADGGVPGVGDWDQDCHPGMTLNVGTSKWYVHERDWDLYEGAVPQNATDFQVPVMWSNQQTIIDHSPGAITSVDHPDITASNCVKFHKITGDRSSMTDDQLCSMVTGMFPAVTDPSACD